MTTIIIPFSQYFGGRLNELTQLKCLEQGQAHSRHLNIVISRINNVIISVPGLKELSSRNGGEG